MTSHDVTGMFSWELPTNTQQKWLENAKKEHKTYMPYAFSSHAAGTRFYTSSLSQSHMLHVQIQLVPHFTSVHAAGPSFCISTFCFYYNFSAYIIVSKQKTIASRRSSMSASCVSLSVLWHAERRRECKSVGVVDISVFWLFHSLHQMTVFSLEFLNLRLWLAQLQATSTNSQPRRHITQSFSVHMPASDNQLSIFSQNI